MTSDFAEWLQNELDKRDLKPIDLARLANKDQGMISRILRRQRKPTSETLSAIAKGLRIPAKIVFEAAGELPADLNNDPWIEEMKYKMAQLDPARRQIAENLLDALLKEETPAPARKQKIKPSNS